MAKEDLNLKDLKGYILSPGNIFWQQKSGAHILLSAKSDFLNMDLIEKLFKANHVLLIEDQINLQLEQNFIENFKGHQLEVLVKEKAPWRSRLIKLFSEELCSDKVHQFEVDQFSWKTFSHIPREQAQKFLEEDIDLFKRSMSVATSYTLCAFMLGYYSDNFLSDIFNETFLNLMDFKKITPLQPLKLKLEEIRMQESLQIKDQQVLEEIYLLTNKPNSVIGERYDGSGFKQIKKNEMTDLELVLVALNEHYSFSDNSKASIFYEIKNAIFKCDEKVLMVLKKCIEKNNEIVIEELSA